MPEADPQGRRGVLGHPATRPVALAALVLVGTALRLRFATQDLFADELATYWIVRSAGLRDVVDTVATTAEITPPLGFILAWASTQLGDSPELIRLPAMVAGICSIPLVDAVGRRTIGRFAALVAATLVTFSPFMTYYAAEGRGYGVLMALVLLSTLALLRGVDGGSLWWWALYALAIALACYTHYTGVFVLVVQLGWALVTHPRARRPAILATTVAALAYLPWLPNVRGDADSVTTAILSRLSPMDADSVFAALGQWSVGFPPANIGAPLPYEIAGSSLTELPGTMALVLLGASLVLAVVGLVVRSEAPRPTSPETAAGERPRRDRMVLIVLLAVASPLGAALQSAIGSNVFRTRSMAPSWPYLALALAALAAAPGRAALRRGATALLVLSFVVTAVALLAPEYDRPDFEEVIELAEERSVGVVVNGATFTPGPLTNFEVDGSSAPADVLRLTVPEQMEDPFLFWQLQPDPADIASRAVATTGDRPILLVTFVPPLPAVDAFVDELPEGYVLTETKPVPGIFEMEARLYEREDGSG